MPSKFSTRDVSRIYLILIPFVTLVLAFAIGHVSYVIYLPVWFLHSCLSIVEVLLIYLATFAFAAAVKAVGWLKPAACRMYIGASLLGFYEI